MKKEYVKPIVEIIEKQYIEPPAIKLVARLLSDLQGFHSDIYIHSIDTANRAFALGKTFNLSKKELSALYTGALLHDVGKLFVPAELLSKTPITEEEKHIIQKTHIEGTQELLSDAVKKKHLSKEAYEIACGHHEKLNGTGYPKGLSDDELSLSARIMTVADISSALLLDRSYRKAKSVEETIKILHEVVERGEIDKDITETNIKILSTKSKTLNNQ